MTSSSTRIAPSSPAATARSRPRWRCSSRPKTTPRSAASRSPIPATARARSTSPPMPSSCWRAQADDVAHPAFSSCSSRPNILPSSGAILATRRRRAPGEPEIWAAHLAVVDGEAVGKPEIETDRARFLGRGHGVRRPIAVIDGRPLSNTVGTVLDPIFALRRRVRIAPGATVRIAFWTMVAASREGGARPCRQASRRHRVRAGGARWPGPRRRCSSIISASIRARPACSSASPATCSTPARRCGRRPTPSGAAPAHSRGCGRMGISGDLPIVLLRIADIEHLDLARQLLQAHEYWRMKQLAVDLVILNERASSYVQDLQIALETLVRTSQSSPPDGVERPARPRLRAARRSDFAGKPRPARRRSRGSFWSGNAARLADQLDRVPEPKDADRTDAKRAVAGAGPQAAPRLSPGRRTADPGVLQRARRLRRGRAGICDDPRAGPVDAGALDQCHRQSALRLPGGDRRQRLHLVGQQPREPAHALVERSGQRPSGRGVLSARRGHRRRCGARRRCRSATTPRPMSPGTAGATAGSSMRRTASPPICCSTCRSAIRSRSPA